MSNLVRRAFSVDLQNGYFHFKIHPLLRMYFCFNFGGEHFECVGLPFGYNWAPVVFTFCMKPVINVIRNPSAL